MDQKEKIKEMTVLFLVLFIINFFHVGYTDQSSDKIKTIDGDTLYTHSTNRYFQLRYSLLPLFATSETTLDTPTHTGLTKPKVLLVLSVILMTASSLLFIYELISMFFNISKGNVFDERNERKLRVIGYASLSIFLVYFALIWMADVIFFIIYKGSDIVHSVSIYTMELTPLLVALFFFILARIFTLARTIKEEQEYTV